MHRDLLRFVRAGIDYHIIRTVKHWKDFKSQVGGCACC